MGATNIHYEHPRVDARGREISAKEAFNNLYEEAVDFSGHDPYSGTIATCELAGSIRAPKDDDEYDDLLDRIDKREVRYYKEDGNWVFIGWAAC
jgi:hypothetical protein